MSDNSKDWIDMGGTANLLTMSETNGIGAVTGTIDGAAYGQPTGEMVDIGNGCVTFPGIHYFLDKDGSMLYTHDKSIMQMDPKGEAHSFQVEYTVVESTGRFAGYRGTFRSRGWLRVGSSDGAVSKHAVGVVRFEGRLYRE